MPARTKAMATIFLLILYGIPTLLFYGWIIAFAVGAFRHRRKGAARVWLFAGLALAPAVLYGAQYSRAYLKHRELDAVVRDAQTLPRLANPPRTLVVHGRRESDWQDELVERGGFDERYTDGPDGRSRVTMVRDPACEDRGRSEYQRVYLARTGFLACAVAAKVDRVPVDGLHLYRGGPDRWAIVHEL